MQHHVQKGHLPFREKKRRGDLFDVIVWAVSFINTNVSSSILGLKLSDSGGIQRDDPSNSGKNPAERTVLFVGVRGMLMLLCIAPLLPASKQHVPTLKGNYYGVRQMI